MARRTKLDAEKTRQSLMDAAEVLFLEQGVTRTSLDQVARRAGVTRGALYWHFANKVDLLAALVQRVEISLDLMFEDLASRYQEGDWSESGSLLDNMRAILVDFFHQLQADERHKRVLSILINRVELVGEMADIRDVYEVKAERTVKALTTLFGGCKARGEIAEACDPETAASLVHSLLIGVMMEITCTPERRPLKEAPELFAMVFDGLRKNRPA
jgi:AcrR family transcriptional regulator